MVTGLQPDGFPHSDISGSIPVCRSPELFAAYHVLPRSRKPRHPPFALVLFLVLISESFATFTSQILLVLPLKLQSLFRNSKKLEFVTLIQTIISFNFFYLVISLSIVNDLKMCIHSCNSLYKIKTDCKYKEVRKDLPCGTNRELRVSRLTPKRRCSSHTFRYGYLVTT